MFFFAPASPGGVGKLCSYFTYLLAVSSNCISRGEEGISVICCTKLNVYSIIEEPAFSEEKKYALGIFLLSIPSNPLPLHPLSPPPMSS